MSGKDVGGDFCSGFPGELGKLVVEQARFNLQKERATAVAEPSNTSVCMGENAPTPLVQEVHGQR